MPAAAADDVAAAVARDHVPAAQAGDDVPVGVPLMWLPCWLPTIVALWPKQLGRAAAVAAVARAPTPRRARRPTRARKRGDPSTRGRVRRRRAHSSGDPACLHEPRGAIIGNGRQPLERASTHAGSGGRQRRQMRATANNGCGCCWRSTSGTRRATWASSTRMSWSRTGGSRPRPTRRRTSSRCGSPPWSRSEAASWTRSTGRSSPRWFPS